MAPAKARLPRTAASGDTGGKVRGCCALWMQTEALSPLSARRFDGPARLLRAQNGNCSHLWPEGGGRSREEAAP